MMNKFDNVLAVHCHTTGLNFNGPITEGHQVLTVGLSVFDLDRLKVIDSLFLNIKYEKLTPWNKKLENIHGLSLSEAEDGLESSEAAGIIGLFIAKHFDIKKQIPSFGYNVASFHLPFLEKLLHEENLYFTFDTRPIDLYPITTLFGKFSVYDAINHLLETVDGPISSKKFLDYYIKLYRLSKILIENSMENL